MNVCHYTVFLYQIELFVCKITDFSYLEIFLKVNILSTYNNYTLKVYYDLDSRNLKIVYSSH